jgi:hypothetical protein
VRTRAIHALTARGERAAIASLVDLLERPPAVTWAVHIALLDGLFRLGERPAAAAALAEVDDLHVQVELARFP